MPRLGHLLGLLMFIVSTISHHSCRPDKIRKIILAGSDVLRYNFTYGALEQNIRLMRKAMKIKEDLNSSVKFLADLPSPRVGLGDFSPKNFAVKAGQKLIFRSAASSPNCRKFVPVDVDKLGEKACTEQTIFLGDGELAIEVMEIINADTIRVRVLNNGCLQAHRGFYLNQALDKDAFLSACKNLIKKLSRLKPHYLALSYIDEEINAELLNWMPKNWRPKIVVKIENQAGINNCAKICQNNAYHALMIDRGELGVNLPFEKLGVLQKEVTALAKKYGKPVMVSTQILESTINNYIPNRSDILDLTNLVLDEVDGIMLCRETDIGPRPAYAISIAKKIIAETEKHK